MSKFWIISLFFVLGLVLFIFSLKSVDLARVTSALASLFPWRFFIVFPLIFLAVIVVDTLKWRVIIKSEFLAPPSFLKILGARLVGFSVSYLTPSVFFGGEPFRVYLIKGENDFPTEKAISTVILDKLILFSVSFVFFFLGIFFLFYYLNFPLVVDVFLFLVGLLIGVSVFVLYSKLKKTSFKKGVLVAVLERLYLNKLKAISNNQEKIREVEREIFLFFDKKRKETFRVMGFSFLEVSLLFLSYWLVVYFLGENLDFFQLFAINSMVYLAYFIPFPAALGSFEVAQAFAFGVFGLNPGSGVAFSLIVRGINLIISALGIGVLVWMEIKLLFQKIINFIFRFLEGIFKRK
jgi:uncharacterized protein (TIRG00374 family)